MLEWLRTRRSVRSFTTEPVSREALSRLVEAATTAPSASNRQPWRFTVVTGATLRDRVVRAIREHTERLQAVIARGPHASEFADYGDFFWEPLATARAIVVPQHREHPDMLANFIASGGGDPSQFCTAAAMHPEICATSAAVMALMLQAHADGLGACWMAGPMVARPEVEPLLGIRDPWRMMGAVAIGHPAEQPTHAPTRRPIDRIVQWLEEPPQ